MNVPIYDDIWNSILDSVLDNHPCWDPELIADEVDKDYESFIKMMDERSEVWKS